MGIYIFLRSFETIFRIPEPNGWRSMRSVATVLRGGSLALYFVLMICIALLAQGTYQTLKGLVAKQRAGDLLKRKVVQMTVFIAISSVFGGTMAIIYLLRENVWKKGFTKEDDPELYYMSSVPFTFVEFFFVLSLWIPNTLENEPFWCGNWCRRSHWFYCCIK